MAHLHSLTVTMHSSKLRGSDFDIQWQNQKSDHATFFSAYTKTGRLGIFAPNAYDGVGAILLTMAYVTAFYNCYRVENDDFFSYPDFFAFQQAEPIANYSMFDIWPQHKNVPVSENANETAATITDRGITILLIPNYSPRVNTFEPVQQEAIRRNIQRCFLYAPNGQVENPNLKITCSTEPFTDWAQAVLNTLPQNTVPKNFLNQWKNASNQQYISQTFQEISTEAAIQHL